MSVSTSISMANNIRRARVTSSTSRSISQRRVGCKCKGLTCFGLLSLHHAQHRGLSDSETGNNGSHSEDARLCGNPLLRSLLGVKQTSPCALHMSAYDPKRT